jgi:pimeloyl-ACP methyl ester carboxylesterase
VLTEKIFNTGELRLNYAEGANNGPPLLVLHGITMKWQRMHDIFSAFTPMHQVYTCDFRGHGKSDRAASYTVPDYVRDTAAFLTQHLVEPVILIGYSLGGLVAMGLGACLPERIRGIVLIDPPLISSNAGFEAMAYSFVHPWVLRTHHVNTQKLPLAAIANLLQEANPEADEAAALDTAHVLRSVDTGVTAAFINDQLLGDFSMSAALKAITSPVLLIHGDETAGSMVRSSDVTFFQSHVPHGRLARIEGWGHDVVWQPAAEKVNAHITAFLDTF